MRHDCVPAPPRLLHGIVLLLAAAAGACTTRAPAPADAPVIAAQTSASGETTYYEFQVDEPVRVDSMAAPVYPAALRAGSVQGEVLVQFVVDAGGRAVMETFRTLRTSHGDFVPPVRDAVAAARFRPARRQGVAVRQFVQMPFAFSLPPAP